jgi:ABC-type lipoprotein export system ATPase subunit
MVGLALSMHKGLVLLDEPTAFLDHRYKSIVWEALKAQEAYPERILLCATNDPAEAALFSQVVSLAAYAA